MYLLTCMPPANRATYPIVDSLPFYLVDIGLVRRSEEYAKYFKELRRPVFIDWSFFHQEGETIDLESTLAELFDYADSVRYPVVILPYVRNDAFESIRFIRYAKDYLFRRYGGYGSPGYFMQPRFVSVASGADWSTFWQCYQVASASGATLVGIPTGIEFVTPLHLDSTMIEGAEEHARVTGSADYQKAMARSRLVNYLNEINSTGMLRSRANMKYCLLGLDHPLEIQQYRDMGLSATVHSVVTRLPFLAATHGTVLYGGYNRNEGPPPFTKEDRERYATAVWDEKVIRLFKTNIKALIDLMGLSARRKDRNEKEPHVQQTREEAQEVNVPQAEYVEGPAAVEENQV